MKPYLECDNTFKELSDNHSEVGFGCDDPHAIVPPDAGVIKGGKGFCLLKLPHPFYKDRQAYLTDIYKDYYCPISGTTYRSYQVEGDKGNPYLLQRAAASGANRKLRAIRTFGNAWGLQDMRGMEMVCTFPKQVSEALWRMGIGEND